MCVCVCCVGGGEFQEQETGVFTMTRLALQALGDLQKRTETLTFRWFTIKPKKQGVSEGSLTAQQDVLAVCRAPPESFIICPSKN